MKKYFPLMFIGMSLLIGACSDSNDIEKVVDVVDPGPEVVIPNANAGINDYIWKAMNDLYLWQSNVPDLADDRFSNDEYNAYLQASSAPENFFNSLLYDRTNVDFFSFFVEDWKERENSVQGISLSNGVDFGLVRLSSTSNDIAGYVRLILPGSDADGKDIKRGDFFTEVDGTKLTTSNYRSLLFSDNATYTLSIAEYVNGSITPAGISVELTKTDYTEPSVNHLKIIEEGGKRIGYLHYTQFSTQESELNAAFLELKNQGITDLVLDLRYNPGGFGVVSNSLASMITGQFKDEVITKTIWNDKYQPYWEANDPEFLVDVFSDRTSGAWSDEESINSLNLSSVHVIGLSGTASASESLIVGLQPYIDIRLVGETTFGKYTGSYTMYDSEGLFTSEGANPDHNYAIQPIVVKFGNKLGVTPQGGIQPDIVLDEDITNMGVIGNSNEPLLRAAINDIIGVAAKPTDSKAFKYEKITDYRKEQKFLNTIIVTKPQIGEAMKNMQEKK